MADFVENLHLHLTVNDTDSYLRLPRKMTTYVRPVASSPCYRDAADQAVEVTPPILVTVDGGRGSPGVRQAGTCSGSRWKEFAGQQQAGTNDNEPPSCADDEAESID